MTATPAIALPHSFSSTVRTGDVEVVAEPFFLPEQSDPDQGRWLFGYRMTITNHGSAPVQLLARHWIIIDGDGRREDVRGPGVVGQTPIIESDESHTYTSLCPLETPWGTMEGSYSMRDDEGRAFNVVIGRFTLATEARVAARKRVK